MADNDNPIARLEPEPPDVVTPGDRADASGRRCDHDGCNATITLPWQVRHGRVPEAVYLCDTHAAGLAGTGRLIERMSGRSQTVEDVERRYRRIVEADPRMMRFVVDRLPDEVRRTIEAAGSNGIRTVQLRALRKHSPQRVDAVLREMIADGEAVSLAGRIFPSEHAPKRNAGITKATQACADAVATMGCVTAEEVAQRLGLSLPRARGSLDELVRRGVLVVATRVPMRYEAAGRE